MEEDHLSVRRTPSLKALRAVQIVTAKFQQITVKQFLPALGITESALRSFQPAIDLIDVSVEFQIAYRFGHDMIPQSVGRFSTPGLFGSEKFFLVSSANGTSSPDAINKKMNELLSSAASTRANEIDGRFSDAIRNTLFGSFGEDLASRNLFRGRELGLPGYMELAKCFGTVPNMRVCHLHSSLLPLSRVYYSACGL
jgi:hypothetical protein